MKRIWEYYTDCFSLFLNKIPSEELIKKYLRNSDSCIIEMQDFVNMNIKEVISWSTGIGIIESVDIMVKEAKDNGNIKMSILDKEFLDYSNSEYILKKCKEMYDLNLIPLDVEHAIFEVNDCDGILPSYIKMSYSEFNTLIYERDNIGIFTYPDINLYCPLYTENYIEDALKIKKLNSNLEDAYNVYKASDDLYEDLNLNNARELYDKTFNIKEIRKFNEKFDLYV